MPDILITDDGPVRTIRMNRLEKKNALTLPMYQAMADAIGSAPASSPGRAKRNPGPANPHSATLHAGYSLF